MKNKIYVLKRSNGFYGIYVNGNKQNNLVSNSCLTDQVGNLIDRIISESNKLGECEIIFTENEDMFKS